MRFDPDAGAQWDKGIAEFVSAARLVRWKRADVHFALVGASAPGNQFADGRQISHWACDGIIEWWGHRSDMPDVYAKGIIVALPSYREDLLIVLIEAAASGRPIVATDIPGNRSGVDQGKNGYLVPVGDTQALAKAISRLAEDPQLRAKMGLRGRRKAEEESDQRAVNQRTLDVYESIGSARLSG